MFWLRSLPDVTSSPPTHGWLGADGSQAKGVKGKDVLVVLSMALAEVARGAQREVQYSAMAACKDCKVGRGCRWAGMCMRPALPPTHIYATWSGPLQ